MPSLSREWNSKAHAASRRLMTQRDAAAALGVSVRTLRRWTTAGVIARTRLVGGTAWYYSRDDVEALIVAASSAGAPGSKQ